MSSHKKLDPPFDPSQPSTPISYPLKTLEDLSSEVYFKSFHYKYNKSSVPVEANSLALEERPRILVCHDMQGGYKDDKWVQGGSNPNAFGIWHWYLIDIFVYFSHNLVVIPPPSWTNTAHRHGVKMLGTFITEGDEGRAACDKLLATKESAYMYAERLVDLAVALGFDGWLLNIEVSLDEGQIPNLQEFIIHLTQKMHSSVPGSLVIWYDAVTITGALDYQNQLNDSNKPFFDICDGILVNYFWMEDYVKSSAAVAGKRRYDVYMGIDVFGRGTYGGGGWNTNVALDVLKKDDISACLFAPGWVWETNQSPDFETAQNRWWGLVEKSWGVSNIYPKALPFHSNFDQGRGRHISAEGSQISSSPWNNLSSQGFQPVLEFKDSPTQDPIQVSVNFDEASYSGGANITFKGTLEKNTQFTTRLFLGNLLLGKLPLQITHSVKSEGDSQLGIALHFSKHTNEEQTSILLASTNKNELYGKFSQVIVPRQVDKPEAPAGWVIQRSSIEMNGYTLTEIHSVCYKPNPEDSKLWLSENRSGGTEISLDPSPTDYYAVLGHITLETSNDIPVFPPSTSWLVQAQHIKRGSGSSGSSTLSVEIIWKLNDGGDSQFQQYNIYVDNLTKEAIRKSGGLIIQGNEEYLGVANVEAFYVTDLPIPTGTSSLKFIVQVCGVDGSSQKLDDSPFLQLNIEGQYLLLASNSPFPSTNSSLVKELLWHIDDRRHFSREFLVPEGSKDNVLASSKILFL